MPQQVLCPTPDSSVSFPGSNTQPYPASRSCCSIFKHECGRCHWQQQLLSWYSCQQLQHWEARECRAESWSAPAMPWITLGSGEFGAVLAASWPEGCRTKPPTTMVTQQDLALRYLNVRQCDMFPGAGKTALVSLSITKHIFIYSFNEWTSIAKVLEDVG